MGGRGLGGTGGAGGEVPLWFFFFCLGRPGRAVAGPGSGFGAVRSGIDVLPWQMEPAQHPRVTAGSAAGGRCRRRGWAAGGRYRRTARRCQLRRPRPRPRPFVLARQIPSGNGTVRRLAVYERHRPNRSLFRTAWMRMAPPVAPGNGAVGGCVGYLELNELYQHQKTSTISGKL